MLKNLIQALLRRAGGSESAAQGVTAGAGPERLPDCIIQAAECAAEGDHAAAAKLYREGLELLPQDARVWCNLGAALEAIGQTDEARPAYRRALELDPGMAEAWYDLGRLLQGEGQAVESERCYRAAAALVDPGAKRPLWLLIYSNWGLLLCDQGRAQDAVALYREALAEHAEATDLGSNLLFTLNYHPDKSAEEIFAAYREYDERFCLPRRSAWRGHTNNRETTRRLKVGYVSPDFRQHSTRLFLEPLLAHHDHDAVEVYAYAELKREDAVTARYRGYADRWIPTLGLSDDALAERIRADRIDILVDLAGHTANHRLAVFARKPAPVSVSWMGGSGYTTGLSTVDYLLTDETSAPAGSEGLFSETPWRLQTSFYVYRPAEGMGPVSALPAAERGHVCFGTLTRAVRINHRTIRVWSQILKRVEGARLVIDSRNFQYADMQTALAEKFAAHGIDLARLEIGFHSPPWDVLRRLDIGLDCFPQNSATTLFESLYMGVPYVTLACRPSVGRLGSSILQAVGQPAWIAGTEEEYIEKAVALASDLPKLASLRARLRAQMESSPLMDEAGFARKVEAAYRAMFEKWARE